MTPKEITLSLYPDYELAAKHWHNPKGFPTIALHGWLDNAASFDSLAPLLPECDLLALDFHGHGLSAHKPKEFFFHPLDLVIEVFLVAKIMGWDQFYLIGHSLGAAIASLMAGTLPKKIKRLVLIDGIGLHTSTHPEQAPLALERYIQTLLLKPESKVPVYKSLSEAMDARKQVNHLSLDNIRLLVERGLKAVDGGYTWRTDPRWLRGIPSYITEEQTYAFLNRIEAPSLLIRAEPGYPFEAATMDNRTKQIKQLKIERLSGPHHIHLKCADLVAERIKMFLKE